MKQNSDQRSTSEIRLYPLDRADGLTVCLGAHAYEEIYDIYSQSALGTPFLLLCGIRTAEEWQRGLSLCHRCICELYGDKREINGYLPRGLMIDTPRILTSDTRFWGCDFFCMDYERLSQCSAEGRKQLDGRIRAFLQAHGETEPRLLCRSFFDEELGRFSEDCHIREMYLSEALLPAARHIFHSLCKKEK